MYTSIQLTPFLTQIDNHLAFYEQSQLSDCALLIDNIYTGIVNVLINVSNQFVQHCHKHVFVG